MTDYLDQHHSSYGQTYRGADPRMDEAAMHRSVTRGSHQSQTSGANTSTKAWVLDQARTIPDESVSSVSMKSNVRRSRPLPTEPPFRQSRVPVKYEMAPAPEADEYHRKYTQMGVDTREFPFGYPKQETFDGAMDHSRFSPESQTPQLPDGHPNRSFVGGFFKGLKRLPKMFKGGGKGDIRQIHRKGTFGTEGTSTTAIGIERGNTLPRYLSNPSIGPSNPQFAHRLSMAVANGKLPPSPVPLDLHHRDNPPSQMANAPMYVHGNELVPPQITNGPMYAHDNAPYIRENPAGPQHPVVTLTPPSDGIVEEQADFYDGPTTEYPQYPLEDMMGSGSSPRGRATVMVYSTESQAPAPTPPIPMPTPQRGNTSGRVSYQQHLPTRASAQAQNAPIAGPSNMLPTLSPVPPLGSMQPMAQSPNSLLSGPTNTSRYTMSTFGSHYDPSFASDLSPIEKFFKGLYNLPWVAERVTVDYRPADSDRAQKKVKKGLKKPMASWYRSVLTRSRRLSQTVDIMSAGSGSISGLDITTGFESPRPRRAAEHSAHRRHQSRRTKGAHRVRRDTASTDVHHPRTPSPVLPTPYPYPYPAVYPGYPYTYPYVPVSAPQAQPAPRGPRTHHRRKASKRHAPATAAAAYAAYQPMALPPGQTMAAAAGPPVYFITPSPPQSNNGGGGVTAGASGAGEGAQGGQQIPLAAQQQQQYQQYQAAAQPYPYPAQYAQGPMQISPVIMQYVPGTYGAKPAMISPPLTPQRHGKNAAS